MPNVIQFSDRLRLWAKSPLSQVTKPPGIKNHIESGWWLLAQWQVYSVCLSCIVLRGVYRKMSLVYYSSIALGGLNVKQPKKVSLSSLLLYKRSESYIFSMPYIRDLGSFPTKLLMHLPQELVWRYLLVREIPTISTL